MKDSDKVKIQGSSIHKRKSKVWPWGYYIPPGSKRYEGQGGLFVCDSEEEAIKRTLHIRSK